MTARATIVRRCEVPLEHLTLDLTETDCGARQWVLRYTPGDRALANGFLDDPEAVARQFDQAAAAIRTFCADGFRPVGDYVRAERDRQDV